MDFQMYYNNDTDDNNYDNFLSSLSDLPPLPSPPPPSFYDQVWCNTNYDLFSSPPLPLPTSPPPPSYDEECYNNGANNNNYDQFSPLPPPPLSDDQVSYNKGFAPTVFYNFSSPQLSYTQQHSKLGKSPSFQSNKSKQAPKKRATEAKPESEENNDNTKKSYIERWPKTRYDAAAKKLADVLRENKRYHDNPMSRLKLRREAIKRIGDTGLLDHLLKHLADQVIPFDNMERLRRRCGDEGMMEYWLESADLVDIRKKAGVVDAFWVPPLGWKLGDAASVCDCHYANEIKVLNKKLSSMESEMAELKKADDKVKQPTIAITLDNARSSGSVKTNNMSKKEICEALMKEKVRVEEQLKRISLDLLDLEGDEAC